MLYSGSLTSPLKMEWTRASDRQKVGRDKADRPRREIIMETTTIQIISALAVFALTVLGFLWSLHRDMVSLRKEVNKEMIGLRQEFGKDMAGLRQEFSRDISDLRERMARMEGLLEGFVARPQESQS